MDLQQRDNLAHPQVAWPRRPCLILAGGGRDVGLPPLEELRELAVHIGAVF